MAIASEYPDVELTHMYVDNAAMQLVRNPKQVWLIFAKVVYFSLFALIYANSKHIEKLGDPISLIAKYCSLTRF